MKKGLLFLTSLFITTTSFAQWTTNGNNVTIDKNIGIGTTNPQTKLDVDGNIFARQNILLGGNRQISTNLNDNLTYDGQSFGNYAFRWGADSWNTAEYSLWQSAWGGMKFFTHGEPRLAIHGNGNIGVGITNPQTKLDVNGVINARDNIIMAHNKQISMNLNDNFTYDNRSMGQYAMQWGLDSWKADGATLWQSAWGGMKFFVRGQPQLAIHNNGNIGIGTTNPRNKLDVNGTIRAREVKVEVENWSDFVFDKDYKLPSLQEVEAHINEHKHLPNIPSETEVKEEGINLSEMQAKLLQKIEELTLYVIELKKENESIKEQVNKLQNE